jgi:PPM family protein phosphatase
LEIPGYHISIGNATDVGRVREGNEDYMAHFNTLYGYCVVVCDGMGGHVAGEIAAQNAVEAIRHFLQDGKITLADAPIVLRNALEFANFRLREMVMQNPALKGMGTTCVLALFKDSGMFVAHAGDSRLYIIRNNEIKQITKDHSTVQQLIDSGALSEDEAEKSDKKNQITKAIGVFENANPAITPVAIPLLHKDYILLCSDGLTAHLSKQVMLETITKGHHIQASAMDLVEKANQAGGIDNITLQIIKYTGKSGLKIKTNKKRILLLIVIIIAIALALILMANWGVIPGFKFKLFSASLIAMFQPDFSSNLISRKRDSG